MTFTAKQGKELEELFKTYAKADLESNKRDYVQGRQAYFAALHKLELQWLRELRKKMKEEQGNA